MSELLKRAREVMNGHRRASAACRFGLLVVLYWGCGPVLNPILAKLHFPDRGMTAGTLALNEGLDFVLILMFSWIVARLGREQVASYGLALRPGSGRLFLSGVLWGAIPSALILIPISLAGACSYRGLAVRGVDFAFSAAMHYERAPLHQREFGVGVADGGFAPAPPGFIALVPLPIG